MRTTAVLHHRKIASNSSSNSNNNNNNDINDNMQQSAQPLNRPNAAGQNQHNVSMQCMSMPRYATQSPKKRRQKKEKMPKETTKGGGWQKTHTLTMNCWGFVLPTISR